jgi:NADPH-dependent 2,4-dienoyl-CoA reductase/sulfur reductase-like enzyme
LAAAAAAAQLGARVLVLDEAPRAGGQIWRGPTPRAARRWLAALDDTRVTWRAGASVVDAPAAGHLLAVQAGQALHVETGRLVVATGARELFLPFPGWTLPNVLGVGALQALVKGGLDVRGRRVVLAGSGPLLMPAALTLRKAGARLALVAEQAAPAQVRRFTLGLLRTPAKLLAGAAYFTRVLPARYRTGVWALEAHGTARVEHVSLTDGRDSWQLPCELLACGYGLIPNLELARLLGCALTAVGPGHEAVAVDEQQRTSVPGVFAAGETTGVKGLEGALVEGHLAGRAAAGQPQRAARWRRAQVSGQRFAATLARTFAPRDELRARVQAETLVCRCEDVVSARLAGFPNARAVKLATRAGMGACQGRVCGPALRFLCGHGLDNVRAPLLPAPFDVLAEEP